MKKYYSERHGLLNKKLSLDFDEVLRYVIGVYRYYCNKGCFDIAEKGVWKPIS